MEINNLSPEQIQQMISMLQSMLPTETKPKTKRNNKKNSVTTKKPKRHNKFEDMQEFALHKEDCEIDKKLSKFPPVPRTRHFEPISVVCMMCGKSEKVSPNIVDSIDRYKCNKCCSR
jgi:lysyl-tRNA synthetase class I